MSLTDEDRKRRRDAKLFNKRVDLGAGLLNALAIGAVATGVILPLASPQFTLELADTAWLLVAGLLHLTAQAVLSLYVGED